MLTNDRLNFLLRCDPETGRLSWSEARDGRRHTRAGVVAGQMMGDGALRVTLDGMLYLAHDLVWQFTHGVEPCTRIGHRNDRLADNRPVNLFDTGLPRRPAHLILRRAIRAEDQAVLLAAAEAASEDRPAR